MKKNIHIKLICLFIAVFLVQSCDDKKKDATEKYPYNAFFFYKEKDKKIYVATVKGLSSCKYIVSDYYTRHKKFIKGEWDYICCLRDEAAGDECAEQHRYE